MIVGNGLIAKRFLDYQNDDIIFFASGVSNSNCNDESEFTREFELIKYYFQNFKNKTLVYFSTVSIYTKKTPYTTHKLNMENFIKNHFSNYLIFRLPQLVGRSGNYNNLFNLFVTKIRNNEEINIINTKRSLLDIDDLFEIVIRLIKSENKIFDIAGIEFLTVKDIVSIISDKLNKIPKLNFIDKNEIIYQINSKEVDIVIKDWVIDNENYTESLVSKYLN